MKSHIIICLVACLSVSWVVIGCSTLPTTKPVAPDVKLLSIKPHKLGLQKQQLAFQLQLTNPNPYDIALQSLSFIARLDGTELAQGLSNDPVTLPADSDAEVQVIVTTRISRVLGQLLLLASDTENTMNYDVSGFVKVTNWPVRIPFNVDGQLDSSLRK